MKILFITSNFYPKKGGVELVVEHLADCFAKNNEVEVISSTSSIKSSIMAVVRSFVSERHNDYSIKRISMAFPSSLVGYLAFPFRFLLSIFVFSKYVNKFSPDVINYHFPDESSVLFSIYLLLNKPVKLITNVHGNDLQLYASKFLFRIFIGIVLNKSERIVVNSDYMKKNLVREFPEIKSKIVIISNGIEFDEIAKIQPSKIDFKNTDLKGENYIFFVGRLVHKKGVDILLNAFAQANIENLNLVIEGMGEEYESLVNLQSKLNLKNKVFFTKGKLSRKEMISSMKSAEFCVMPSRIEPFGIVALEIMAAGKAIIAANTGGLKEIIEDKVTGLFFESENIADLAEKIKLLHNDKLLCENIMKEAYIEAKKYSWDNIVTKYLEIFD